MKKREPDIEAMMAADAGKGVQRFPWLGDFVSPWVDAIEAIDKSGNKTPLIELLNSDTPLGREDRFYLANLLHRYQLKNRRGGQEAPAYDPTPADLMKMAAKERVDELRKREDLTIEQAIAELYLDLYPEGEPEDHIELKDPLRWPFEWRDPVSLKVNRLRSETLLNYCKDKLGSARRKKRRRPEGRKPQAKLRRL